MTMPVSSSVVWSGLSLALLSAGVTAQTQVVKPPVAQYWMDISTVSMAGMDDIPGMGALAGMVGNKAAANDNGNFGATKSLSPGRWLDLAVTTQRKPAGTQATQTIPAGLNMGPSLSLLPVETTSAKPSPDGRDNYEVPEQPKGRVLLYWGCGDTVREGQPKVLDFSTASQQDYAKFMTGRGVRLRGATAAPGHAIWPNAQNRQSVPKGASLAGQHVVSGDGLPPSLQFVVPPAQDLMPPLALAGTGGGNRATAISWTGLPAARAYFLNAMGGSDQEMVVWSSSEVPEPGWGLMDYIGNANLDKWLGEKVLLAATQTRCAIPAGIFAKADGAMVQGIAYGQDLQLTYPARPTNPKVAWEPEWTAQIRVKSQAMLPLEQGGSTAKMQKEKPLTPAIPGVPDLGGALGGALKGLFGR
jgi:hypothetical protein